MSLLVELDKEPCYLKAGFFGFPKAGKTYTAIELAIGTAKFLGCSGPIAMFDTEGGSAYVREKVLLETGQPLLGVRSRSFSDLMDVARECLDKGVSVLIVDSITHVWRELCEAYLQDVNKKRRAKNYREKQELEFNDWAKIKRYWSDWTSFFLNAPIHIIICGRAGYIYDMAVNEDTGKKELLKTGTKMKVESEFAFEPSLIVEMEQVTDPASILQRQASVLGDRFTIIDGQQCLNPTFDFFKPHVEKLAGGEHMPIDTQVKTPIPTDENGYLDFEREKKQRTILCEEIQGLLVSMYPGQTAQEKKAKADALEAVFMTRSWTAVESLDSIGLAQGLTRMKEHLGIDTQQMDELPL